MRFIIAGNKGQLGREFVKLLSKENYDFTGFDIDEIDICDFDKLYSYISNVKADIIINCTAYNLVDKAEEDTVSAFNTNEKGVKNLALASAETKSLFIHYSSDYVFDGLKKTLYTENDETNPLNQYGKSKLAGELAAEQISDNHLVFRVSWLYGNGMQNFIAKFLSWTQSNSELKIADNEVSVPTSAEIAAEYTLEAAKKGLRGKYHLTNSSFCSRFKWAQEIKKIMNLNNRIIPVKKEIFNLPAARPDFSAMSNELISKELQIEIPEWEFSLEKFLKSR